MSRTLTKSNLFHYFFLLSNQHLPHESAFLRTHTISLSHTDSIFIVPPLLSNISSTRIYLPPVSPLSLSLSQKKSPDSHMTYPPSPVFSILGIVFPVLPTPIPATPSSPPTESKECLPDLQSNVHWPIFGEFGWFYWLIIDWSEILIWFVLLEDFFGLMCTFCWPILGRLITDWWFCYWLWEWLLIGDFLVDFGADFQVLWWSIVVNSGRCSNIFSGGEGLED